MTAYFGPLSQALTTLNQGSISALAALFLILALGELGVPFPLVLTGVLFPIGYEIGQGVALKFVPLVLVLIAGSQFGCAIVYFLARWLGNPFIHWLGKRFPRWQTQRGTLEKKLGNRTILAVAIGRLTPGLMIPTSLISGATGLRYDYFALGVLLTSIAWDGGIIASGIIMARGVQYLGLAASPWLVLAGLATVIGLVWAIGHFLTRRKSARGQQQDSKPKDTNRRLIEPAPDRTPGKVN